MFVMVRRFCSLTSFAQTHVRHSTRIHSRSRPPVFTSQRGIQSFLTWVCVFGHEIPPLVFHSKLWERTTVASLVKFYLASYVEGNKDDTKCHHLTQTVLTL